MYNLGWRLIEKGHKVTVLTTNMDGGRSNKLPSEEVIDGIHIMRLPVLPTRLSSWLALAPSIISKILSVDADIFHVFSLLHFQNFLTNTSCIMSKLRGTPLVVTPAYHPFRYLVYRGLTARLRKTLYDDFIMVTLLKKAACVIALTEAEARYYRKRGIENVHVIPIGVDFSQQYRPNEIEELKNKFGLNGKIVLHVGRLDKRKGIQYAIQAMSLVLKDFDDAKLLVVGPDAGYGDQLRDLARNLGIKDAVVFTGRLSSSELASAYRLANMVVIPSLWDSFNAIAMEAFAYEKPLIMSKTVGFAERITAKNGILIDPGDYKALAKAIGRLLSNQHLAISMGKVGRQIVEKEFAWEMVTDKLDKVYRSIVT
jgi:glycosyltransferase involved in cell wall biosynthesis